MTYVLDTDVSIEYLRNNEEAVEFINQNTDLAITSHTLAELLYGLQITGGKKHETILRKFLSGLTILGFGIPEANIYGAVKAQLRGKGRICGDFDIAIAATAAANQATLVTNNIKHYQNITGLRLLKL